MMTYVQAIDAVLSMELDADVRERMEALRVAVTKRNQHTASPEAKEKANEKRKAKAASARADLVAQVAPIVLAAMDTEPRTVSDITERCADLPEGFTAAKVQYLLLHELAEQVDKIETKGKANTYALKG